MEWLRQIVTPHFDDDDLNRQALNLNVIVVFTFVVMLLGIVAMLLQIGKRPLSYVLPNTLFIALAACILVVCYSLSRRGKVRAASITFVVMITIACTGAVIAGGTRGALPVILVIPIVTAGVTLSPTVGLVVAILGTLVMVTVGILEINGLLTISYVSPQLTILLNMFDLGFSFIFLTLGVWLAGYSLSLSLQRTRQAVTEAESYRQELEKSYSASQDARHRLQSAIQEYSRFLGQIGQGDYTARLSISQDDEALKALERQINQTIDTLVQALQEANTALEEVDAAQRRYLQQSWRYYLDARPNTRFELVAADSGDLRSSVTGATAGAAQPGNAPGSPAGGASCDKDGSSLALLTPITLRGQVLGTLGLARPAGQGPWSEEEKALVEGIAHRLALAAENMRLLEATQRRAALEQMAGEINAHIRQNLDLDLVLQAAVREIGQALDLAEVEVALALDGSQVNGRRRA